MIYISYIEYKSKYYNALSNYNKLIDEWEKIFGITQPKATTFDKERVSGGQAANSFDTYIEKMEEKQLNEKINIARSILEERTKLLKLKEEELRLSSNPYDKIYTYRFIDRMKIYKISRLVGYGEAQTYRILRIIRKNIKLIENDSFKVVQ